MAPQQTPSPADAVAITVNEAPPVLVAEAEASGLRKRRGVLAAATVLLLVAAVAAVAMVGTATVAGQEAPASDNSVTIANADGEVQVNSTSLSQNECIRLNLRRCPCLCSTVSSKDYWNSFEQADAVATSSDGPLTDEEVLAAAAKAAGLKASQAAQGKAKNWWDDSAAPVYGEYAEEETHNHEWHELQGELENPE